MNCGLVRQWNECLEFTTYGCGKTGGGWQRNGTCRAAVATFCPQTENKFLFNLKQLFVKCIRFNHITYKDFSVELFLNIK